MHKNLRYLILLTILLLVAVNEALIKFRTTSWDHPLWVRIYAVNGDGRAVTDKYIDSLTSANFKPIEEFFNQQARGYGISIDAISVEYNGRLQEHPPQPPSGHSILENIWWSLSFRAWALYRGWTGDAEAGDVELFVSYYDIATSQTLRHSVGLEGGLIGIINAFADESYQGSNRVVIAHELMHTLGASDKYDANNHPVYPDGFAEPYRDPLYPQRNAEIMGGRIPVSAGQVNIPESLRSVVVGPYTAAEINWPVNVP